MKKNTLLLVSWVLSALYVIYIVVYMGNSLGSTEGAEQAGAAIATALMFPHILVTGIGLLFNILGWAMNKRGFALTGAILYAVAMVLFPIYFFFVLIQMILSFVGYSQLKKQS